MKDEKIYELMKYLPQEYLDEDLQFHMQQKAASEKAEKPCLTAKIAAMLRRFRKEQPPQNEIDRIFRTPLPAAIPQRNTQNDFAADWFKEDAMKQEKHVRKLNKTAWVLIAAMVLAIGGTAAAVGYSMHKQKKNSENRLENELSENETPPDTENAVIFPKLTNQQDEPEMHCYPQTDSGFFYLETLDLPAYDSEERRDILRQNTAFGSMDYDQAPRGLRYYDAESGETVFVCAKPNCLHDGSEFCTATTQNYFALSYPVVLDDAVYLVALDYREYLQNRDNCTKYPTVLLRYAQDGTEVSEVARLYLSETPYHCYADLIAHRGQLWINCVYSEELIITDENLDYSNQHQRGKWEMYCYEPQTKKLTTLMTSGELQNDYNPAGGMSCRLEPVGRSFRGIGDYVYFHKTRQDWRDPVKGSGIFRIDCRTGLIEEVLKIKQGKSDFFTISGDYIFYSYNEYTSPGSGYEFRGCNMKTGEEIAFPALESIALELNPWLTQDMLEAKDVFGTVDVDIVLQQLLSSNGHLYAFWQILDRRDWYGKDYAYISEFDSSGKLLHTAEMDKMKGLEFSEEYVRKYTKKNGYSYDVKRWVAPGEATQEDLDFLRYQGCWETEDGEWIHPNSLRAEDIEHYQETGYYVSDFKFVQPEDVTEETIQMALKDRSKDLLDTYDSYGSFKTCFDGKYFYLHSVQAIYRITPKELFSDMNAERIFYMNWE